MSFPGIHRTRNELWFRRCSSTLLDSRPFLRLSLSTHPISPSLLHRHPRSSSRSLILLFALRQPHSRSRILHYDSRSLLERNPTISSSKLYRNGFISLISPLPPPPIFRFTPLETVRIKVFAKREGFEWEWGEGSGREVGEFV